MDTKLTTEQYWLLSKLDGLEFQFDPAYKEYSGDWEAVARLFIHLAKDTGVIQASPRTLMYLLRDTRKCQFATSFISKFAFLHEGNAEIMRKNIDHSIKNTKIPFSTDKKSVIIVGKSFTKAYLGLHIKQRPEAEVWSLNEARHPEATRHFEIHEPPHHDCSDLNIPVYYRETFIGNPQKTVKYPLEKVLSAIDINWMCSTIVFMLALAIYEGFEEIFLPGVDLLVEERPDERDCLLAWIFYAKGLGIEVKTSNMCTLTRTGVYS